MPRKEHRQQIDGLVDETILGGMSEDIEYKNEKEAKAALEYLKKRINSLKVEDIYR